MKYFAVLIPLALGNFIATSMLDTAGCIDFLMAEGALAIVVSAINSIQLYELKNNLRNRDRSCSVRRDDNQGTDDNEHPSIE